MRRTWIGIWTAVLFAAVALLVTRPVIDLFQAREQIQQQIQRLESRTTSMDEQTLRHQKNVARWYNLRFQAEDISDTYDTLLNFGGGIMGYLEIPAIDVILPLYHGTEALGAAHDQTSALPIGGRENRTAFTGLGDIYDLSAGDLVCLHILGETHVYAVGEQGSDLCVLYGKNRTGQEMSVQCARLDPETEQDILSIPETQMNLREAVSSAVVAALGSGMILLTGLAAGRRIQHNRRKMRVKTMS